MDSVLTPDLARTALKRAGELEKESLILPGILEPKESLSNQTVSSNAPKSKSSLPLLLTIFGVLVAILGFVLYLNQ
jgi:hypothetical protein